MSIEMCRLRFERWTRPKLGCVFQSIPLFIHSCLGSGNVHSFRNWHWRVNQMIMIPEVEFFSTAT